MRPTPFDLAFGPDAEPRFERIRVSLAASGRDPHDADAFVLDREVVTYLRELVPEEGVGEAMQQHIALLQHAYLYWDAGAWLFRLTKPRAQAVLAEKPPAADRAADVPRAYYLQLPERLVWAELQPGEPHQPLDGLFVRPWPSEGFFLLAIFGLHPAQGGFSVVDVDGYREAGLVREEGVPLFSPTLSGGGAAGLHSIVGSEELFELAARTLPLVADARACAGGQHRAHQPVDLG